MLDKVLRISRLYDYYGALLTDKQRYCLEMHYLNDLSLAEIAEELRVSRQAVHDILRRGEQILEEYEAKLGLVERCRREQDAIREVYDILAGARQGRPQEMRRALTLLESLLNREEEIQHGL